MPFERTFHPDEANQAFTVGHLLETGTYAYNPADHHGPTLYYAAAPIQRAFGAESTATLDASALRLTPLVFAFLALFFAWRITKRPAAMLVLASAPIFFFFSTFFIQEMLLAAFVLGMLSFIIAPSKRSPFWLGIFAGLAFATKETAVLVFFAAFVAWLATGRKPLRQFSLSVIAFLAVTLMFYSDFCRDFSALHSLVQMPVSYLHRAFGNDSGGGIDHVHPWYMHLKWLFASGWRFSEFPAAIIALAVAIRHRSFLAVYAIVLFCLYSLIPYKTPWCTLQLAVPLLLIPFTCPLPRIAKIALPVVLALGHIPGLLAICAEPDSKSIPYNYASASPQVQDLAALVKSHDPAFVAVALPASDTWPIPFYLREINSRIGYWTSFDELNSLANLGGKPDMVIVPAEEGHLVQPLFPYMKNTRRFEVRPMVRIRVFW